MDRIIDTALLVQRKTRALGQASAGADFLIQRAASDLADRLSAVQRRFDRAVTLFCATSGAKDAILESGKAASVVRIEADQSILKGADGIVATPETVPLSPGSIGLAVSLLALQDANDLPGMLIQIRRALSPDGLFLGVLAGSGTLHELRESLLAAETEIYGGASPRVSPFLDIREAGALLQRAGFALPVADLDTVTVRYDTMFGLLRDLRGMGATSALEQRSRRPVSRRFFQRAAQIYAERFSDADGRIRATFALVWLSGWGPDASQQKPARRGSATVSLAEILGEDKSG